MYTAGETEIHVLPDRQRTSFNKEKMLELMESIASLGLLHPPVCRINPDNGDILLVAGFRRFCAIRNLHAMGRAVVCNGERIERFKVPYLLIAEKSEDEYEEAELHENLRRLDLTWTEESAALARIHSLRKKLNPEQTYMQTAREISQEDGPSVNTTREKLSKAKAIEPYMEDPEVKRARSLEEAFRIVSRKLEDQFSRELEELEKPKESRHLLIHGDMREMLPTFPAEQFSLVIADPPYGVGASNFGDAARGAHKYEDDLRSAVLLNKCLLEECYRVTKQSAMIYIFCDIELFSFLRRIANKVGWKPRRTPLIWSKGIAGHIPEGGTTGFRRSHELIFQASKGGRIINRVVSDVIPISALRNKVHAAEKPPELYEYLVNLSVSPGDKILDPCCGSGTIFVAAARTDTTAVGIERDGEYHDMAASKLREVGI